tara:strand:- start:6166 stop:6648 length:483 start_codon:yes stop_codon:yes gene_type:complete
MAHLKMLTGEQVESLEELGRTLSIERLADRFGFNKSTMYRIFRDNPEYFQRYKKGASNVSEQIGNSLIDKALSGDTSAQIFYLKTKDHWRQNAVKIKADDYKDNTNDMLSVIINKIMGEDGCEADLDIATLNTLNSLIKTKAELTELSELKLRLDNLERG